MNASAACFGRSRIPGAARIALLAALLAPGCNGPAPVSLHVWEKTEIRLEAKGAYADPYREVEVWVDLEGPGFAKRCFGFWDGGNTFLVRVLATSPGSWTWKSGSNQNDRGLNGQRGAFAAVPWTEAEKASNPLRRGMVRPTANGRAFEYADGTPFFLLGDTWWPAGTHRFPWRADGIERPLGPAAGFQDYVRFRRAQGFNTVALIAAFPNWANDGFPNDFHLPDGTEARSAWRQAGTSGAMDMADEDGQRAFLFPGRVPGAETVIPDLERINPAYFRNLDRKIAFFNAQGIIPFIEAARRDIGPAWRKFYPWPDSYTRYVRYLWARTQSDICFFSPIHFDWDGSLPADEWNLAANRVIETYGHPPFGTLVSANASGSSLLNFGHTDRARWIGFHQIGNFHKTLGHGHRSYPLLTDIFNARPPLPAINGEPYYDGQHETVPGSETAAEYCRSAMYGSVLSGGLGGHIYGAGKENPEGAIWNGNIEPEAKVKIWEAMAWESADDLRHLRTFVLSEGKRYQDLIPAAERLDPRESGNDNDWRNWAYAAGTADGELILVYFEPGCRPAAFRGVVPGKTYRAAWFDPRSGEWPDNRIAEITADGNGRLSLPEFSEGSGRSRKDWALKLTSPPGK